MTFGKKKKKYRQLKKLTQAQVAEAVGISKRTYIYYELGQKYPRRASTLYRLAELFGIDSNLLIVQDDERYLDLLRETYKEERSVWLINELRGLLQDDRLSDEERQAFYGKLKEVMLEFQHFGSNDFVDTAPPS